MSLIFKHPTYTDFKKLSQKRIDEAIILLDYEKYSGAYYLAGYSIELAFKACFCKDVKSKSFPPKKDVYNKLYSHDLNNLLDVSGIKSDFNKKLDCNIDLNAKWGVVKDWNAQSRYAIISKNDAQSMVKAISDTDGILNLIKEGS